MHGVSRLLRVSLYGVVGVGLWFALRCAVASVEFAHVGFLVTAVAASALVVGAGAALRGRTWGVAFLLAVAASFHAAATALLAVVAISTGGLCALAWHQTAPFVFALSGR